MKSAGVVMRSAGRRRSGALVPAWSRFRQNQRPGWFFKRVSRASLANLIPGKGFSLRAFLQAALFGRFGAFDRATVCQALIAR
jgi:hypothetical protein